MWVLTVVLAVAAALLSCSTAQPAKGTAQESSTLEATGGNMSLTTKETVGTGAPPDDPLSSHVLDTVRGIPAPNLTIKVYRKEGQDWAFINGGRTNHNGRLFQLLSQEEFVAGTYKMRFETGDYFSGLAMDYFHPYVEIVFQVRNPEEHYHIPLLLSPYGYTTYRGS